MTTATAATPPRQVSGRQLNTPPQRDPRTDAADRPAAQLPHDASVFQIVKQSISEWAEDKCAKLSASLAFFAMLSLAPLIVITIKIMSVALGAKAASGQLQQQVSDLAGQQAAEGIQAAVQNASKPGAGTFATSISILIAIWGAAGLFGELQDSFNTIWEVQPKPNQGVWGWIRTRFLSMAMVMGVAFLLLVSMVISAMVTRLSGWLLASMFNGHHGVATTIAFVVDLIVSTAVVTVLFAAMFKFLPDVRIEWRDVWLGAFVTAVLFQIGKYLLGFYFGYAAPGSPYGAAGSLVALLVWVYYSGWILYYGAEFTQVYARRGGRIIEPTSNAVMMSDEDRMEIGVPHREDVQRAARRQSGPATRRATAAEAGLRVNASGKVPSMSHDLHKHRLPAYARAYTDEPEQSADGNRKSLLYGAGGLLLGAIAGGVTTYFAERGMLPGTTPSPKLRKPNRVDLTQVNLENRLSRIEDAAGDVESFEHKLRAKKLDDEVEALSHRIREAELRLKTPVPQSFAGRMADLYKEAKRHWSE